MNVNFKGIDIIISILIVGIVILMVIPIPPFLLDFLQFFNIALSIVILLSTLYIKRALDISIFPSLLLITTLFRLALNVSSTRLILLEGKNFEGKVVKAFGDFVVGGNYIVGLIIFLVLVIIQFLVITKGTERIAEVAARFTLDAMPGKQMSIDADLSAGLISEEEARQRREDIRREADFYGAMDGASKFVRGDAIAGLIITLIDIVGGILIGVLQQGLDFGEAAELFALLTIGDGLVAQIPALLISTSAGMIVSRTASKDNFGKDLLEQLTSDYKVLSITGSLILFLGLFTPLPIFPSLVLGGSLLYLGYSTRKVQKTHLEYQTVGQAGTVETKYPQKTVPLSPPLTTPEEVSEIIQGDTIEVDIGYGLIPLADPNQGGDLLDRITVVRKQLAYELGIIVPPIRIRDSVLLSSNEYVIKLKGVEVGRFELIPERLLAINSGMASEELPGIKTKEPSFGLTAYWIDERLKDEAVEKGYTTVDAPSVFATHLSETIKKYAHEIVGIKELEIMVDGLRVNYASLVDTLIPTMLKMHELKNVINGLLYEKISVRNLPLIFESLIESVDKYGNNIEKLIEEVRISLGRQIVESIKSDDGQLHVVALDPNVEKKISNSIVARNSDRVLAFEPEYSNVLVGKIAKALENMMMKGYNPVIICSKSIRYPFSRFILKYIQNISIIAYEEVPHETSLSVEEIVEV
ncbi:MAG: flagellar biosynthesis protein FlhA [Defluviitoga tunisiensis]|jgi:flagellar biosynthesis protein FlhA